MKNSRRATVAVLVPAALLATGAAAQAQVIRGTVVHRNHRAHSLTVADRSGRLSAIHSARAIGVGGVVVVSARRLRNGTYAARSIHVSGHNSRVRARGTVTYVNRRAGTFTLSGEGVSMLVRSAGRGARSADALPPVGTDVTVSGELDSQGSLDAQSVRDDGTEDTGIDLEGTILSINTTTRTLTLSADDNEQSGQAITVTVPATLDLTMFAVGQDVELQAALQPDGSYLLQGSSEDANSQDANNQGDEQGAQEGEQSGGGDQPDGSTGDQPDATSSPSGSTTPPTDG